MEFLSNLLSQGISIAVPFTILLGLLIFVHELGHFLVAKYYGVHVEVFSLGFGKKIFSHSRNGTEYCLSIIPFGGYVKMYGDEPSAEVPSALRSKAFNHKPVGQRIAVVLAGPLMNLFFAYFLFLVISVHGESVVRPILGDILSGTAAFNSGFRSYDQILSVGGTGVENWDSLREKIEESAGKPLSFRIVGSNGTERTVTATPQLAPNRNVISSKTQVGDIAGLSFLAKASIVAVPSASSPAGLAGLQTGDIIRSINGAPLSRWLDLEKSVAAADIQQPLKLEIMRGTDEAAPFLKAEISWPKRVSGNRLSTLGIQSSDLFVSEVLEGAPAKAAGVLSGDRLKSANGKVIFVWEDLVESVESYRKNQKPVHLVVERAGKDVAFDIVPKAMKQMNAQGKEEETFALGVRRAFAYAPPETVVARASGPAEALKTALTQTVHWTETTVLSFVRIAQKRVSAKSIGGPLMIGQLASETFKIGLSPFLKIMAIISLNLFVLNLLPVPVLDGGHLLFYLIEFVKGAPLSLRKMEVAQQIGLVLLLALMVFALFNDVTRILNFSW